MKEISVFNNVLENDFKKKLIDIIYNFDMLEGGIRERNTIKTIDVNSINLNIKSFRIPNIVNRIVYNFFRKSKAQRSFEYASRLMNLGVGTPKPIAFFEFKTPLFFNKSYYVSEQLDCDITYRELTFNHDYPDFDIILRAFTRFTFSLHEKGINFLDHSPGNTLIKKNGGTYDFYLVDLNRMRFGFMDFKTRIKNFSKLTIHKSMVEIMSDEYAKCSGEDYNKIFNLMWNGTEAFQEKYHRKKRLKKKLKFWKS